MFTPKMYFLAIDCPPPATVPYEYTANLTSGNNIPFGEAITVTCDNGIVYPSYCRNASTSEGSWIPPVSCGKYSQHRATLK